jgi:EF-hand domain-containing family member B
LLSEQGEESKECVANLMRCANSAEMQLPDADLGKTLREGYRNIPPPGVDSNRAYGVPSVRTDLHLPARQSIANAQNYGNEPDANALLSPCSTADRGVNEDTFSQKRTAENIKQLLDSTASIRLSDAEFDEVFQAAAEEVGNGSMCTLTSFMRARHKRLHQQAGL